MDMQDKSKEELIIELQELQRENESLKSFYNTSINELRQSELVLQDIIAKNPMSIQIIDKDGFTLLINSAHTKLFGAVPPNNYSIFTDPLLHESGFSEHLSRAKAGEVVLFPDFYYNVHDLFPEFADVPVWIRMVIFPLLDRCGKPERYVLMHENITERKQAEEALRESEENHRNLLELAPHAFFQGDLNGNIILANEKASILTGFSKEELLKKNMKDFFSPFVLNNIPLRYDLLDKGETLTIEREVTRKDGSIVIVEMRSRKMPNNTYQSFMSDISERKQAEAMLQKKSFEIEAQNEEYEELNEKLIQTNIELSISKEQIEESEKKYRLVFENVPLGIIHYNNKGEIISCNERFVEIIGSSKDVLIGLNMSKLPDKNVVLALSQSLSGSLGYYYDDYHSVTAAKITPVQIIFAPIFSKKNEVIGGVGIVEDVTERKRNEEKLKKQNEEYFALNEELQQTNEELSRSKELVEESEAFLWNIFDNIPNMLFIKNASNLTYFQFNKAGEQLLGYKKGELIGKNDYDFFPKEQADFFTAKDRAVLDGGNCVVVEEEKIDTKFGQKILYTKKIAIKDARGNNKYLLGISEDITAKKEIEAELINAKEKAEENEAKYSNIVKILPDGIIIHSAGKIVFMNDAALKIIKGKSIDDYIGQPAINFVHPDYRELAQQRIKNSFVDKKYAELVEEAFIDSDNNPVYVLVAGSPFKYQGQPSMLTVFTDITRIKAAEQELIKAKEKAEENEKKFRVLVETSPDAIVLTDIEGNHLFRNAAYYESLGFSVDENVSLDGFARVHPEDILLVKESMKQLMVHGIMKGEYRVLHKEGYWVYRQTIAKIINNERNEPHQILTIIRDISDNKKAEQELIKAKEKAEESDRLKTAFLANMSHEIRTPMNGILGFAELLKRPQLSGEQQKEYISIIEKSGIRMLNIINDIIDISKIESGEIKVTISDTNINEQLNHILNFFKPEVARKGLSLNLKSSLSNNEATIKTDREKVYAILTNLVKNAIKFTDKGFIEVGCAKKGAFIEFCIKDTGIGIPKNRHQAVFERFVQADVSDSRAFQGAGLGLAITKAFVEMLGGMIWFESEEHEGSIFYFTIPNSSEKMKKINDDSNSEEVKISSAKKIKVLIAEDDEPSDLYITILLDSLNCEIFHAKTGTVAVDICRKNPDLDLILMDIKMPDMNGYEATMKIRQFNHKVVIIAQTAHALAGDKEKAIEVGCNYYLTKPLNQIMLFELIQKHFDKS